MLLLALLTSTSLASGQIIYLTSGTTNPWTSDSDSCTISIPCTISGSVEIDVSTNITIAVNAGSYASSGVPTSVTLNLAISGLLVTLTSANTATVSASNPTTGLSWSFVSTSLDRTAYVAVSYCSYQDATFTFSGLSAIYLSSTYFEGTTLSVSDTTTLGVTSSTWIAPTSTPTLTFSTSTFTNAKITFNSVNVTCGSSCLPLARLYSNANSPYILFSTTDSSFIGLPAFSYVPYDTDVGITTVQITTDYRLTSTVLQSYLPSATISYSASTAMFASWNDGGYLQFYSSNVSSVGLFQELTAEGAPLTPLFFLSVISNVSLYCQVQPTFTRSTIINSYIRMEAITGTVYCTDSTFHLTAPISTLGHMAGFFIYDSAAYLQDCNFTEADSVTDATNNNNPTLLLSNSVLHQDWSNLYRPSFSVARLGIAGASTLAGIVDVTKSMTGYSVASISSMSLSSSDVNVSFVETATSYVGLKFSDSFKATNVVLQDTPLLRYYVNSTSPTGAIANTASYPFLSGTLPTVALSWASNFAPTLKSTFVFLRSNMSLAQSLPAYNSTLSQADYSFTTQWTNSTAAISKNSISFAVTVAPLTCSGNPPSASFTCVNGVYVSPTSVTANTTTTVVFSSPTVVNGNFSVSSIEIIGLQSTLNITGCASLPQQVTVVLTPAEYEALVKSHFRNATLLTSSCLDTTLSSNVTITVETENTKKSCHKLSGSLSTDSTSMIGTFVLNSSGCNTWWIILASVLGGVVLLVVILVIIFTAVPSARRCIRPYVKREQQGTGTSV